MRPVRYQLAVDSAWNLEVRREDQTLAVRTLQRIEVPHAPGCRVPVAPGLTPDEASAEASRVARLTSKLSARDYAEGAVKALGVRLFENLLGADVWGKIVADAVAIGATRVELALSWAGTDRDLHRLNWELLCDGVNFLAEGRVLAGGAHLPVVITRVVAGANFEGRKMSVPTRFLFVVGCSLEDPRVTPGAEYLALMRQLERMDPARMPSVRVLAKATPTRLRETVAEFQPDVVLVVAHGVQDGGEVRLEFQPDKGGKPGDSLLGAQRLLDELRRDEAGLRVLPALVVLSACYGGAVDDFESLPFLGGTEMASSSHPSESLSAALVAGGVPVVIGMGGRISDRACRLFTQFFCSSIVGGRELMDSLERGRRGAFMQGEDPTRSHDWSLPLLFLAEGVTTDFRPTPAFRTGDHSALNTCLMSLGLHPQRTEPVWAARFEALDSAAWGLFREKPVLVLIGESGSGKSRMLRELAAHVVRSGHFPIHLDGRVDGEEITSAELLRKGLFRAYQKTGEACGFDWSVPTQIDELRFADQPDAPLKEDVRRLWRADDRVLTPQVLRQALRHDLRDFATALQAKRPGARPVVFLGHVEILPAKFVEQLLQPTLLTAFGLGTAEFPIPVVLTLDGTRLNPLLAKSLVEGREPASWFQILKLDPLVGAEAVGACERVLLHPHNTTLHKAARTPWILNRGGDPRTFEKRIGRLLDDSWNPALPSGFSTKDLYRWVVEAEDDGVVRAADDNDIIRELEK